MPDVEPGLQKSPIIQVRGQTNRLYPDRNLTPEMTATLSNINLTEKGTAKKRGGYSKYNSSQITESGNAKDVTGIFQHPFKAGTELASFAGTKFYEETAGSRTDRTGSLSLTDNTELRWRTAFIQDSMVATNGTAETVRWTGTGNATDLSGGANVPWTTCRDLVAHKGILVALRPTESSTDHTTRVRWCDIDSSKFTIDITNFPLDSRSEVYDQGPPIIGGADFNGFLHIFKEDGFYLSRLDFDMGFIELVIEDAVRGFEPIATNSILTHVGNPSFVWVIARDGAYVVFPDKTFHLVTKDVQSDWNDLNLGRLQYAVSWVRKQDHQVRTLLSSESNTEGHDRILIWDWQTGDVWFDSPKDQINFATSAILSNNEFDVFGSTDGYIHQANDTNQSQDNSQDFTWDIRHVPTDLGFPGIEKNIINSVTYYRAQAGEQTVEYNLFRNEGRSATQSGNLTLGTGLQYDVGLKYDSGKKYPGGVNAKTTFFVNKMAETIASRWTSDQAAEILGVQYEFVVTE